MGKNNWLFFGSDNGGRRGAIFYSLVCSAKANRSLAEHPEAYLGINRRIRIVGEAA